MKKHFLMIATVAIGIMVAFASCKDNKRSHADDEDDEDDIENVEKDLEDEIDDEDEDVATSEFAQKLKSMDDLKNLDVDGLTAEEADELLQVATSIASKELPEDMGDGMQMVAMALEGEDVSFHVKADESKLGMTIKDFSAALNMPEMKEMMLQSMSQNVDDDMLGFMKIVKKAGKNLAMKFVNDSGEMAVLRLTNDDMSRFIK